MSSSPQPVPQHEHPLYWAARGMAALRAQTAGMSGFAQLGDPGRVPAGQRVPSEGILNSKRKTLLAPPKPLYAIEGTREKPQLASHFSAEKMENSVLEGIRMFSRISGDEAPPVPVELRYERERPQTLDFIISRFSGTVIKKGSCPMYGVDERLGVKSGQRTCRKPRNPGRRGCP